MTASRSALVVGGGLFGAASAAALVNRGWSVVVLDPDPLSPRAASVDVSKLVRAAYGADEGLTDLADAAIRGWRMWNDSWWTRLYREVGVLLLTARPMAPGGFEHDSQERLAARGHTLERLDADGIAARFPAWEGYVDGFVDREAGWVDAARVTHGLLRRAWSAGATVREEGAASLITEGDRVVGAWTSAGEALHADTVVLAAGAWTPRLAPWLDGFLRLVGQPVFHLRVDDPEPWQPPRFLPWAADVAETGWYGFPALDDGTLKIANHGRGIPLDPDAPREVPREAEEALRSFLAASLPALVDAPIVERRVCLYCDTPDGDFLIDRDPEHPGLVVATGGSGHAFKFAPLLGQLVADAVEERPNPQRDRFRWRTRVARRVEGARSSR